MPVVELTSSFVRQASCPPGQRKVDYFDSKQRGLTEKARRVGRSILAKALLGENPQLRRQELRAIPNLSDFVADKYLPFIKTYKRSWCTDETVLRIHILPSLGRMALDEITAEHIIALVAQMRQEGYAAGTSNRVVMILRYLYNLAAKWKVPGVASNPTSGVELGQEA